MASKTETKETSPQVEAFIRVFRALVVLVLGALIGSLVWHNATASDAKFPFKLGLDLAGGSHLVYEADVSKIDPAEVPELMAVLRDVIERRINVFGVSEPIIQVEESSFAAAEKSHRLVVELPGVTDVEAAVAEIGRTPLLEFKLMDAEAVIAAEQAETLKRNASGTGAMIDNIKVNGESVDAMNPYTDTGRTGR